MKKLSIEYMCVKYPTPEDATSGKTNICKKLKTMKSDEKHASVYM